MSACPLLLPPCAAAVQPPNLCLFFPHSPRSKYREAGFYVSHAPEDNDAAEKFYGLGDASFKDAVLDLTAEDAGAVLFVGC